MKKFKRAFTMIEISLVLVILGIFFILLRHSFSGSALEQKSLIIQSRTFYGEVQKALTKISFEEVRDDGLKSYTSEGLAIILEQYLTGEYKDESAAETSESELAESELAESELAESETSSEDESDKFTSCSKFKVDLGQADLAKVPSISGAGCFETSQGFLAAVVVDSTCKINTYAREYFNDDSEARLVKNVCGFVAYEPAKKAKGIFGEDLFVIPFGNRGVK